MDKNQENPVTRAVRRRISSIKVAVRMLQDELDMSGDGRINLERTLVEDLLESLELFTEDLERDAGVVRAPAAATTVVASERRTVMAGDKPVARLN